MQGMQPEMKMNAGIPMMGKMSSPKILVGSYQMEV